MLAFALSVFAQLPVSLDLDRLTGECARALNGNPVVATFLVMKPAYSERGNTAVGSADLPDRAERWERLRGRRYDVQEGTRVAVVGILRVTAWPATFVDGQLVQGWVGIEVRE
jgi:hypothetical protein